MSIRIIKERCNGCRQHAEPCCTRICPGDLLYRGEDGRAAMRDNRDCWDCAACIKECPRQALAMYLPAEIGGRGACLTARKGRGQITWTLTHPDGRTEVFEIPNERII